MRQHGIARQAAFGESPTRGAALSAAGAAQGAAALVQFGLAAVGPELQAQYELSIPELGAILAAWLLGTGLLIVPVGTWIDRYGARAVTLVGALITSPGLTLASVAPSAEVLFFALVLSGAGAAVVPVAGTYVIFTAYSPSRRGWAFGVRQTAVPIGGLVAVALTPVLADLGGLRLLFLAMALATGGTSLFLAAVCSPRRGWDSWAPGLGFTRAWRAPEMKRILLIAGLYVLVVQALIVYTIPAARAANLSISEARLTFLGMTASAVVSRVVWGRVADRKGGSNRRGVLMVTGWISAIGSLLFALALDVGPIASIAAAVAFAFGAFGWNAIVYVIAAERSPPDLVARAMSLTFALVFLLSAAGTPALGMLVEAAGWDVLWFAVAVLSGLGALVSGTLMRQLQPPSVPPL